MFLSGVSVEQAASAVVTLGDSLTDGVTAAPDSHPRWPDVLAQRLAAAHRSKAVVNVGLFGDRLRQGNNACPAMLQRAQRDVFSQPGVDTVIVLAGINDLTFPLPGTPPADARDVVEALRTLTEACHQHHLRVILGTLLPFDGSQVYSTAAEANRQIVNRWILSNHGTDGSIDFSSVVSDPSHPQRLKPGFDSGDHLHPNAKGLTAMGQAVPLRLFP
jgi:lysophospholipase L1-like esterase